MLTRFAKAVLYGPFPERGKHCTAFSRRNYQKVEVAASLNRNRERPRTLWNWEVPRQVIVTKNNQASQLSADRTELIVQPA